MPRVWGRKKRLLEYATCAGGAGVLPQEGAAQMVRELSTFADPNLLLVRNCPATPVCTGLFLEAGERG